MLAVVAKLWSSVSAGDGVLRWRAIGLALCIVPTPPIGGAKLAPSGHTG
jgi:hypothetical protein